MLKVLLTGLLSTVLFFPISEVSALVRPILFPVSGEASFRNDYLEPRDGGAREHLGIDIIAKKMTPIVAVTDGTITFIAIPQASWGYAITIRDSEGYSYRYLHINNDTPGTDDGNGGVANAYAPNLSRGTKVVKGQLLGWVGDSGNAEATVSHLHFEIMDPARAHINPYDSLIAAAGSQVSQSAVTIVHATEVGLQEEDKFLGQRSLQEGMVDKDVATLHTELKALGYYSGSIIETYTSVTREAVRKFQNANKLAPTGIADTETRRYISLAVSRLPVTSPSTSSSLALGASGVAVTQLQTRLKELGYFTGEPTGYFGSITEKAVIEFQKANNIDPIGIVGPKTRLALDSTGQTTGQTPGTSAGTSSYIFVNNLQIGSRGEDVRVLQILLSSEGFFTEEPTGYFGALTFAALVKFQNAHGIEPLGIVGPKTRAVLNLL